MIDRTSKFLLTAIALLLLTLLVRPMLAPVPAQAQTNSISAPAPTQMAVSNGEVFLLQDGKLSIYQEESATSKKLAKQLGANLEDAITLHRVAAVDVNKP